MSVNQFNIVTNSLKAVDDFWWWVFPVF